MGSRQSIFNRNMAMVVVLAACGGPAVEETPKALETESFAELTDFSNNIRAELTALEGGTGEVEYQLTNIGNTPTTFLPWNTALSGMGDSHFEVLRSGEPVEYVGLRVHLPEPKPGDFIELAPSESVRTRVRLPDSYQMDRPGQYQVRIGPRAIRSLETEESATRALWLAESDFVGVSVDAEHLHEGFEELELGYDGDVEKARDEACFQTCVGNCGGRGGRDCGPACDRSCNPRPTCSLQQDLELNEAEDAAVSRLRFAIAHVDRIGSTQAVRQTYLDYFGIRIRRRQNIVRETLKSARSDIPVRINDFCRGNGVIVDNVVCGPARPGQIEAIALTNGPFRKNVVYCPRFFGRSLRRRIATVVHESVHHFGVEDINNLSDNLVNSNGAARALAANDAEAAIASAVNYAEYVTDSRFGFLAP